MILQIELGAGDGAKVMQILKALSAKKNLKASYVPIDISVGALRSLEANLCKGLKADGLSGIDVNFVVGDFMKGIQWVADEAKHKGALNLVLFLGTTIGNLERPDAVRLLQEVRQKLNRDDMVLIGIDHMKSVPVLRKVRTNQWSSRTLAIRIADLVRAQ